MFDPGRHPQRRGDFAGEVNNPQRFVGADIESLVLCGRHERCPRYQRGNIVHMSEGSGLLTITKQHEQLAVRTAIKEDANKRVVNIREILPSQYKLSDRRIVNSI